jgi:hypothetical protein
MEAEVGDLSREEKDSKLRESVQLLNDAIERFGQLGNFPLREHEIADSYSLLARTYLVAKDLEKASQAMRSAFYGLENRQSKEYADLLILNGDFEFAQRKYSAANSAYEKALELQLGTNAESSEIRARALRQRGLCFLATHKNSAAKRDLNEAAEIWDKLEQRENSATARWEAMLIDQKFPSHVMQLLEEEGAAVKVEFAEMHLKRMTARASAKAYLSSREQPDKSYFEHLIKQARQQIAIRNLHE